MRAHVLKAVQKVHTVELIGWVTLPDLLQESDLVLGRLGVVLRAFLDLWCTCELSAGVNWCVLWGGFASERVCGPGECVGARVDARRRGRGVASCIEEASMRRTFMAPYCPVSLSSTSHTVEKWPQPSFLTTVYCPLLYFSPTYTGW